MSCRVAIRTIGCSSDADFTIMDPSITTRLCTLCGLCCDGSLLADVELRSHREALEVESMGLEIEDDEDGHRRVPVMLLPCRALKKRCCTVYAHRPHSCRDFECRVLKQAEAGVIRFSTAKRRIDTAHQKIRNLKTLIKQLGGKIKGKTFHDTWTDYLSNPIHADDPKNSQVQKLAIATDRYLQKTFLDES